MASKRSLGHAFLRKKFRKGMTFRNYRDREVIFSQGDPADSVFYIESGTVKLTAVTTRKKAIIAILQRGSFFGEGCLAGNHSGFARRDQLDRPMSFDCKRREQFARSKETLTLQSCLLDIWFHGLFE
jgi:CRP-like cAMP-binding protein